MDWFITNQNGEMFHTLWQCVKGDNFTFWSTIIYCSIIFILYLLIAKRALKDLKLSSENVNTKQIKYFIGVFIACGITGYLFLILEGWFPVQKIKTLSGIILAGFTLAFVWSSRKGIFSDYNTEITNLTETIKDNERIFKESIKSLEINNKTLNAVIKKQEADLNLKNSIIKKLNG